MTPIFLDFETYWSDTHTLSKVPPPEYVMHPDTEIISVAYKIGGTPTQVVFGEDNVKATLACLPWDNAIAIGHNMSGFDCMLLKWRCGIEPKMWGCTAAMARPRYAKVCGVSLKALVAHLGIGVKDNTALLNTKGRHLKDFTQAEIEAMRKYNADDTEQCAKLFAKLHKDFPRDELLHIDMTTRMLVDPVFELDEALIIKTQHQVAAEKTQALLDLSLALDTQAEQVARVLEDGLSPEEYIKGVLASSAKFSELLQQRGVDVPMKASPTNPQKLIPALSKTDDGMQELLEHEDPVVAEAARCRLQVKSTLLETRLEAFRRAGAACGGKVPVPLRYCGADTTGRWSGEQYNPQNLPRIPRDKEGNIIHKSSNALRMALRAPKGYKVIVSDLSGIELRVNMFLWQVPYAMELFKADPEKADLYKYFAAHHLFNILEEEINKDQRQVGKVSHLGLGFGAGGKTFLRVAKTMAGIKMELHEAERTVNIYRQAHPQIQDGWYSFQNALAGIANGFEKSIDPWGLCITEENAVRLPSGRRIHYPGLRLERDNGKSEWKYGFGRHLARIYGPKGVENLVQALARDVIADNAAAFFRLTGFRPALAVHDELVYVVPEHLAEQLLRELQAIMRKGVDWWPELVTWSEGDVADSYGEAK